MQACDSSPASNRYWLHVCGNEWGHWLCGQMLTMALTWGIPANKTRWSIGVLMLVQRLRRWPNIKTPMGDCPVIGEVCLFLYHAFYHCACVWLLTGICTAWQTIGINQLTRDVHIMVATCTCTCNHSNATQMSQMMVQHKNNASRKRNWLLNIDIVKLFLAKK